jgi:hypothetical protein
MTRIIGLNGPPGCGKNAVADELCHIFDRVYGITPYVTAIAEPLRRAASAIIGVDLTNDLAYAKAKATCYPHLDDETAREVMINLTESYLKPRYGREIWVASTIRTISKLAWHCEPRKRLVILTDVGFPYEREALEAFYVDTAFVELDRPGHSYVGDSRGPIHMGPGDPNCIQITNPGDHQQQLTRVAGQVHQFVVSRLQWDLPNAQASLPIIDGD